jgi:transposase
MGFGMARRTKRLWTDEEKRSICFQTKAPNVSVAQVARRYGMNANLIFKWLRDPNFAPEPATIDLVTEPSFLPVEIVVHARPEAGPSTEGGAIVKSPSRGTSGDGPPSGMIEIDLTSGHRLRVSGAYDPETLACLVRSLSR